jgi:hypothetical protein
MELLELLTLEVEVAAVAPQKTQGLQVAVVLVALV